MAPKRECALSDVVAEFLETPELCTYDRHSEFDVKNLLENVGLIKALGKEFAADPIKTSPEGHVVRVVFVCFLRFAR